MAMISRRHLLTGAGALGFASGVGALSLASAGKAWAANTSGYKALVCVFLKGGLDHADTILPYDPVSYEQLANTREGLFTSYNSTGGASSRNRSNLLPLNPKNPGLLGGRELAFPRELAPLHEMFSQGDLAILGNVGPLIEPTLRRQLENNTAILPARLFSHNDQQSTWMAFGVEGERRGWGGVFADAVLASSPNSNPAFVSISTTTNDVFLSGNDVTPFRVSETGAPRPALISESRFLGGTTADDEARSLIRAHLARRNFGDRNVFTRDLRDASGRAVGTSEMLLQARENESPFTTDFNEDPFGRQLKSVAETIRIQSHLNAPRQIFYVSGGNFDTHNGQATKLPAQHTALAGAMSSFKRAMQEIGQWNNVTVFTMSEFGRTLIDNGNGTDHGWGGHQFIAGGQVNGGHLYGEFPVAEPNSESHTLSRGRLIPTTSVEQYASTLGRWFGLDEFELGRALPNLGNFGEADLGFMH